MKTHPFFIKKATQYSTLWIMVAAFLCYTGMYAVRKSFLSGQYLNFSLGFDLDVKTVLVISQVLGYMCSKFLGIKIISEMSQKKRSGWLIGLVSFGLLMLLLFAYVPARLKVIAMFLNGLPLGMVFGLVLSYLEGRRNSELLIAALSATFIFSTGMVKATGVSLIQDCNISENMAPFYTGLLFFPFFLLSVWMLSISKKPSKEDITERSERMPMNGRKRKTFLKNHWFGFFGLVFIYILLTVIRDFRDNFIVEFWAELGYAKKPSLIILTEIPVAIIVLIISAAGILIRNNYKAFNLGMWLTCLGGGLVFLTTLFFKQGLISPVFWVVITGISVYLPYILFHCVLFERLIALLRVKGNIGFLFYIADALGYLGSVSILIFKETINYKGSWVSFFESLNINSGIAIVIIALITLFYFRQKANKALIVK